MHDYFWGRNGRRGDDWYEPEPEREIFLAAFLVKLGEIRFGPDWSGSIDKPSEAQAAELIKEIAQAAASAVIVTHVLNPMTFEFQPIARAGWRNPKALAARFSRCRIDASDPVSSDAEGRHHGRIFVERRGAISYLENIRTAVAVDGAELTLDYLSDYIRFMIFFAQSEKLDNKPPLTVKVMEHKIENAWLQWSQSHGWCGELPATPVPSVTMRCNMATLLRGEKAGSIRKGSAKKR